MHNRTKQRIAFLQRYIQKHVGKWFDQYGDNLTSVQVHHKTTKRKKKRYYALVFHVVKKKSKKQLSANEIIPESITIKFPDRKKRSIKTDVKQTGPFQFHARPGDEMVELATGEQGTLGLFVSNTAGDIFAITNYHVAAHKLIGDGIFSYDVTQDGGRFDVRIGNMPGRLFKGRFDQFRDVAFVALGPVSVSNTMPDDIRIVPRAFIPGPLDVSARGQTLKIYLRSRLGRLNRPLIDNAAPCSTQLMQFAGLITVKRCAMNGDSGGVVLTADNRVLGIIFGSNDESTFIIPYSRINEFLPLIII